MVDPASQHVGDCFDPSRRVQAEAGLVIGGIVGSEVIQQQKRIEVVQAPCANTSLEPYSRSFNDRLGLDNLYDLSLIRIQVSSPCLRSIWKASFFYWDSIARLRRLRNSEFTFRSPALRESSYTDNDRKAAA